MFRRLVQIHGCQLMTATGLTSTMAPRLAIPSRTLLSNPRVHVYVHTLCTLVQALLNPMTLKLAAEKSDRSSVSTDAGDIYSLDHRLGESRARAR